MGVDQELAGQSQAQPSIDADLTLLLDPSFTPQQVAEEYFKACAQCDALKWLACLHLDRRSEATHRAPGPFHTCQWEAGRARVEKYMVSYKYLGEADKGFQDKEPFVTLKYLPCYGPVPGYEVGKALGMELSLVLSKQDGAWRIKQGSL